MELLLSDYNKFLSPYLMGGFKKDSFDIRKIIYGEENIKASLNITEYFMPSDGKYHFTAFHTQLIVSQLLILHMCLRKEFKQKPGETYMRDFSMKLVRSIHKVDNIEIVLNLKKIRDMANGVYVSYNFNVDKGALLGNCSALQLC